MLEVIEATVRMPSTDSVDLRVPLVVGACGHRDILRPDRDALSEIVYARLRSLMAEHRGMPLIVLSALADGADRIVAAAALRLRDEHPGDVRLIAPLPMRRDLYARDFHTPASLDEFCGLLDEADEWFELDPVKGHTAGSIQGSSDDRDRQYQAAGKYVARHCEILLALWDGESTNHIAGTFSTVRFKLEDPSARGPVHQIVTPRAGKPEPDGALRVRELYPRLADSGHYKEMFKAARAYNELVAAPDEGRRAEIASSMNALWPLPAPQQLPRSMREILARYSAADRLAVKLSQEAAGVQRAIHWWAFGGLACFEAFAHGADIVRLAGPSIDVGLVTPSDGPMIFVVRAVALLMVGGAFARALWLYSNRQPVLDRHQDYRALAEGLRVQFFWRIAGIGDSVSDFYLGKCVTELEWIRHALRGWCTGPPDAVKGSEHIGLVQERWIGHQCEYFAGRNDERLEKQNARWIDWLLRTAVVGGLVWLACGIPASQRPGGLPSRPWVIPVCTLVIGIVVAWLGLPRHRSGGRLPSRPAGFTLHRLWATLPSLIGGLAGGVLLCAIAQRLSPARWSELLEVATILVVGLSLAGAGLLQHYGEKMAFKEHAKQSRSMHRLFDDGRRRMRQLAHDDDEQRRMIIRTLGESALEENGDWVMLHRERPLEVPLG